MAHKSDNPNAVRGSGKDAGKSSSHKGFDSCDGAKTYAIATLRTRPGVTWFRVYKLNGKFYPAWNTAMIPKGATKVVGYARAGGRWEGNGRV